MTTKRDSGFTIQQVRTFVKSVRKEAGDGWHWLVPRLREALIAERTLQIIVSQHSDTIEVERINALLLEMLIEAGLCEND